MKTKSPIINFVLYGSQVSTTSQLKYQQILENFKSAIKNSNTKFFLANPNSLKEILLGLVGPTLFYPLFLMEGVEFNNFNATIQSSFHEENLVVPPLCNHPSFLNQIFTGDKNTIYLMHGSKQYDNRVKHQKIISYGEKLGYTNYCFLEGEFPFKEVLTQKLSKGENVLVTPLLFIKGKHTQTDLIDDFLKAYDQEKWQVKACLLERTEIVNTIIDIGLKALN